MTATYVIRGGGHGRARLHLLAEALWPTTERLLLEAGLGAGMSCLDAGCGGGDVSVQLARMVGPLGSVTAVDVDDAKIVLNREAAERAQVRNLEFRTARVDALEDDAVYDLVYARFLLTHLRDPAGALGRLVRATKPGGAIVLEDIDHSGVFSYPACPALERFVRLYNQAVRARGGDPEIGPKLPGLLREGGLANPRVAHVQPVFDSGEIKSIHQLTLENVRSAITASQLATDADLDAIAAELDEFVERPDTIVSTPRIFQVWARK